MTMIPLAHQIAEVGREIGLRRNVYPKFISSGRLTKEKAAEHIARMEAVLETLKGLRTPEEI